MAFIAYVCWNKMENKFLLTLKHPCFLLCLMFQLTFTYIIGHADEALLIEEVKQLTIDKLGFFLEPSELFSELARRENAGEKNNFILGDLAKVLTHIEQSTMGS